MKKLLITLTLLPIFLFGQTATFRADSTHLWYEVGQVRSSYDQALEMEWIIRGQSIHFGSKPIEIIPESNRIDTVFYKQNKRAKWDTFLCVIKEPLSYRFVYNDCCDAFYVFGDGKGYLKGEVIFELTEKPTSKTYLGTLGESGILVRSLSSDTLKPVCRSPMNPNIYSVTFSEIKICKDSTGCREGTCLFVKDDAEPNYDFGFKTVSCKTSFLYMPLGTKPLELIFDPKTNKVLIK